ncbi:peroxidase 2-like [Aegilops tauschii subsp. strangulata]|uniref:Peroxidase 2 n=1 Tax=Aegilops tauschii TaxID=37682 RepID=N1R557_AEGTA|nr:peroxidase 2-like [Aegilops tauschii subsp. strangulata]XP_044450875.1 peroxidase 2-like [Triticum aestivum]
MALASRKLSVALACVLHYCCCWCRRRAMAWRWVATKNTCPRVVAIVRDEVKKFVYKNVLAHKVLFTSDTTLLTTLATTQMVRDSTNIPRQWEQKFNKATVKMGAIEVKTGYQGKIRRKCRVVDH